MLATKKVKQQCSSKSREIHEKLVYCGVAQAGPGTTGARKQEGKKASALTMFELNGYVEVSSAILAQIQR